MVRQVGCLPYPPDAHERAPSCTDKCWGQPGTLAQPSSNGFPLRKSSLVGLLWGRGTSWASLSFLILLLGLSMGSISIQSPVTSLPLRQGGRSILRFCSPLPASILFWAWQKHCPTLLKWSNRCKASEKTAHHHGCQRRNGRHLGSVLMLSNSQTVQPSAAQVTIPTSLSAPQGAGKWGEGRGLSSGSGCSNRDGERHVENHVGLKKEGRQAAWFQIQGNSHQPTILPH